MAEMIITFVSNVEDYISELDGLYNEIQELNISSDSIKSSGEAAEQLKAIVNALQTTKNEMAELIRASRDFASKAIENTKAADRSSSVK